MVAVWVYGSGAAHEQPLSPLTTPLQTQSHASTVPPLIVMNPAASETSSVVPTPVPAAEEPPMSSVPSTKSARKGCRTALLPSAPRATNLHDGIQTLSLRPGVLLRHTCAFTTAGFSGG